MKVLLWDAIVAAHMSFGLVPIISFNAVASKNT